MPESVCEELLDELFDNPFLTFADYLSLLREANKDQRERPERKTSLARLVFLKDFINSCWRRGD